MSQLVELSEYVKRMGEHVNLIYKRLEEIDEKITALSTDVNELKSATETNTTNISTIIKNTVSWTDFDDFIKRLIDSFKDLPPIPGEASEGTQDEPPVSEEASTPRTEDDYWPGTD